MLEEPGWQSGKAVTRSRARGPATLSDELHQLLDMLSDAFPEARKISFEFDGRLTVRIDVRSKEQVSLVMERLPYLGAGQLFSELRLGQTPNHAFDHRITARVAR